MNPGSEKPLHGILNASQTCLSQFESCLSQSLHASAELERAERRFRAWTNNLKVFSQDANLDAQLSPKKYDQIRQMIGLLLNVLNENLALGMQPVVPRASLLTSADSTCA